jgi:hypothetical protein
VCGGGGVMCKLCLCNLVEHGCRLERIREAAGEGAVDTVLRNALANDDFDGAEYDKLMEKAFGEDYYEVCQQYCPCLSESPPSLSLTHTRTLSLSPSLFAPASSSLFPPSLLLCRSVCVI